MAENVAIIHDWLNGMRGGEKVLEQILGLYPQADLYTLFYEPEKVSPLIRSKRVFASRLNGSGLVRKHYQLFLPWFPRHIEAFDLRGYSLVISSSHCVAKGAVPSPDARHVSYVHSPMRYAWDQYYAYFGGQRGWRRRIIEREISKLRVWDVSSAARVDAFAANSTFVARRIERYYRRQATVIHPPVDVDFFQPAANPGRDYYLLVSALVPYKNIETVIRACMQLKEKLIIVGRGPEYARLKKMTGRNCEILPAVDAETLRKLYQHARAFVFAGVEDFGIALAESQACGTPVIALDRGGVRDIVSDGVSGVLFPEPSADALTRAMRDAGQLAFDAARIRAGSMRFAPERFRSQLAEFIEGPRR
jgi:glycosyltransferase involved in cell wall biosynthesis